MYKKFKKSLSILLCAALVLPMFMIFGFIPVSAAASTLDNCDSTAGWSSGNTLSVDTTDKMEGSGSLKSVGSGTQQFNKNFSIPVNAGVNSEYGILQLWIYISDVSAFTGSVGQIEIGSSGATDVNEYSWDTARFVNPNLRNGWNIITLKIREAAKTGTPNLAAINWFRYYNTLNASVTIKIDKIMFDTLNSPLLDGCESTTGWSSWNTLSIDGNDLRYGTASLVSVGSGTVLFAKSFGTAFNTAINERSGSIHFDLYVEDVTKLGDGQVEITSSGTSDTNEYHWDMATQVKPYLINGWNSVDLKLSLAVREGNPDLSAINWFRIYSASSSSMTTKINGITFNSDLSTPSATLDECNSTTSWVSGNALSLDTANSIIGSGCLSQSGSNLVQFQKSFATAVNSSVTESYGYLKFWYYISNVSAIDTSLPGQVEISSSGTSDSNEYAWSFLNDVKPSLHNGWNLVALKLTMATKTGTPNLSSINWFRIYQPVTGSVITKVDNIVFVKEWEFPVLYPNRTVPSMTPHPQTYATTQSSDDVCVAMYNVTDYGAATTNNDNTAQFQNALNDAYNAGGGVVFVPAGQWNIRGHLVIREGVTLRGDWKSPESGGLGQGTILKAYEGRDNENYYAFISMENASLVRDLTVWYPEQNNIGNIHAYPWTFRNTGSTGYYASNLWNITLINSYNAIKVDSSNNASYFKNIYGTALKKGIHHDGSWDIGKAHTVWFRPKYWANSGLGTPPAEAQVEAYTNANATAITIYKNDWGTYYDLFLEGYNKAISLVKSQVVNWTDFGYNGSFEYCRIQDGTIGVSTSYISPDNVVMFSNCNISVVGTSGTCVKTESGFTGTQTLSFSKCTFSAPNGKIVDQAGSGVLNFTSCTFSDWSSANKAINASGGSVLIEANYFNADKPDISLGAGVSSAVVTLNSYLNNTPDITNSSTGDVKINTTDGGPADFDSMSTTPASLGTYRKPPTTNFYNVVSYGAVGDGATDNTTAFQNALNAASAAGGGTVYVPGGRYKFTGHLSIASNVELRGVSDGPHHYGVLNRGTVLLPYENQNNVNGTPFITLGQNSGVRGLSIYYINQYADNVQQYPPTIFSNQTGAYAINVTMSNAYYGIKIQAGNYYIDYCRIFGLNTGIWIDGVSTTGYIINCLNTMGDWWLDSNCARSDLWLSWPPVAGAVSLVYSNSSNIVNVGNFCFGYDKGVKIIGSSSNNIFHQLAVDNSQHAILFQSFTGTGVDFINTQVTGGGSSQPKFVSTDSASSGTLRFFNGAAWGNVATGVEINGTVTAKFLQWRQAVGNIDFRSGTCYLESSMININPNQVSLQAGLNYGAVVGCMGNTNGFGVNNYKGAPDIWMNIRR